MTAITASVIRRFTPLSDAVFDLDLTAATAIPKGALVRLPDATGLAINGTDTAAEHGCYIAEFAAESGDATVTVRSDCIIHEMAAAGMVQADVGDYAFLVDNNTIGNIGDSTNDGNPIGVFTKFNSATSMDVWLTPFARLA